MKNKFSIIHKITRACVNKYKCDYKATFSIMCKEAKSMNMGELEELLKSYDKKETKKRNVTQIKDVIKKEGNKVGIVSEVLNKATAEQLKVLLEIAQGGSCKLFNIKGKRYMVQWLECDNEVDILAEPLSDYVATAYSGDWDDFNEEYFEDYSEVEY